MGRLCYPTTAPGTPIAIGAGTLPPPIGGSRCAPRDPPAGGEQRGCKEGMLCPAPKVGSALFKGSSLALGVNKYIFLSFNMSEILFKKLKHHIINLIAMSKQ